MDSEGERGTVLFLKDKGNGHRRNTEVLTGAAEMRRFLPGVAFFRLAQREAYVRGGTCGGMVLLRATGSWLAG